jgi:hypothetical protein
MLGLVSREELEKTRARIRRRRRIITLTSIGAVVLLIVFLVLFHFTDIVFRFSPDIQSVSQFGEWAAFLYDL